jgi:DNA-binding phage protein
MNSGLGSAFERLYVVMTPDKRAKLLNEAFENNDADTLQAILRAQPFLSGMSAPEHDHYLRRLHEKQNPHLVARLSVMRAAMDKLGRDGTKVMVEMQKAVGAPPAKVKAIDAANERALASLRIEPTA